MSSTGTRWCCEGLGKARLIGVDTPEVFGGVECFGREASAYAKRQLDGQARCGSPSAGRSATATGACWCTCGSADGRSFNALLVSRGYAQPLTVPPNDDYADAFVRLARRARERGAGLWSSQACQGG